MLREEFSFFNSRTPSLWTRSYFIVIIGSAQLSTIKKYVQNQKLRSSVSFLPLTEVRGILIPKSGDKWNYNEEIPYDIAQIVDDTVVTILRH